MGFTFRFVWEKLKGRRWMLIVGFFVTTIASGLFVVNPVLSKRLVDEAIKGKDNELLIRLLILMCLVTLFRAVLIFVRKILFEMSSQMMISNMRIAIFNNIQTQEMSFFDKIHTGDLITRSNADINHTRHFVAYTSFVFVETVVLFIASVIALLRVNIILTLSLLLVIPILGIASYSYNKKIAPIYQTIREDFSKLNTTAQENIEGNRVVKAFAREDFEMQKFDVDSRAFRDSNLKAAYERQKLVPIIEFLANSLTFITLLVGGILVINENITIGELTMFTSLSWALALPIRNMSTILNNYRDFITSTVKIVELCEASPLICDRHDAIPADKPIKGKIEFRDVSFAYESKPLQKVLDHVSFVIEPGETIAIMGPTGSGKTSLISLISRFYDVTDGSVLLDGIDVRMRKLSDIRKNVAVATQDVFLFSDTVDGNIAFSNPDMDAEKVHTYASLAVADSFIRRMEEGYETIIGERGVGISGGQKQRLALARAMAAEAPVLILDDTTSAVDMETEKVIQDNLEKLPVSCTKIIIAQRISSVKTANRIMILENGKLSIGTHEELAATNAYYRSICELQDVLNLPAFTGGDR